MNISRIYFHSFLTHLMFIYDLNGCPLRPHDFHTSTSKVPSMNSKLWALHAYPKNNMKDELGLTARHIQLHTYWVMIIVLYNLFVTMPEGLLIKIVLWLSYLSVSLHHSELQSNHGISVVETKMRHVKYSYTRRMELW